jgi:tetratricopeptide (TPR) repeat protein
MKSRISYLCVFFYVFLAIINSNNRLLFSKPTRDVIKSADNLYEQREDVKSARLAYHTYKEALKNEPQNYEALWKAAKTGFYLTEVLKNKKEKKLIVKESLKYAKEAVKLEPKGVEGHFWLGVLYTKYGELYGVLKSLFLIRPAKREMKTVLKLDETYELAGAYVVLGRINSQVPGLFGGSDKKARIFFEKVREIFPKNSLNLLFLAETYWDLKKKELAIKILKELIEMIPDPAWEPETKRYQLEAKVRLKKYSQKK